MKYYKLIGERGKHQKSIVLCLQEEVEAARKSMGSAPILTAARLGTIQSILLAILNEIQYMNDKGNGNKEGRE